jgi:hypothetical protein
MKKIAIFGKIDQLKTALIEVELVLNKYDLSLKDKDVENKLLITLAWKSWRGFDGILEKFVISKEDWAKIKPILMEKEIYFGEIAGKHSEIFGNLKNDEITECSDIVALNEFQSTYGKNNNSQHSFLQTLSGWLLDELYEYEDDPTEHENKKKTADMVSSIVNKIYGDLNEQ